MTQQSHAAATDDATGGRVPLTAGVLAMTNLQAQIDGRQRQVMAGQQAAAEDQAELIELVALRGEILGRIMWLKQGHPRRALTWFDTAVHLLPACAPAQGHLAQVQAALGNSEAAITRLRPLTTSSDDPRYAVSLARILGEVGRAQEAAEWRDKAARRYDELVMRHPEAFADHAAESSQARG